MSTTHEATVVAAEQRVAARRRLDDVQRGTLAAVRRHSPSLAPRVTEVLKADERNAERQKARRDTPDDPESREARQERRRTEREAFIERGEVL